MTFEQFITEEKNKNVLTEEKIREILDKHPNIVRNYNTVLYNSVGDIIFYPFLDYAKPFTINMPLLVKNSVLLNLLAGRCTVQGDVSFVIDKAMNYSKYFPLHVSDRITIEAEDNINNDYSFDKRVELEDMNALQCNCDRLYIRQDILLQSLKGIEKSRIKTLIIGNGSELKDMTPLQNFNYIIINYYTSAVPFNKNIYLNQIEFENCSIHTLENLKAGKIELWSCVIENENVFDNIEFKEIAVISCTYKDKEYNDYNVLRRDMRVVKETTPEAQELFGDFL